MQYKDDDEEPQKGKKPGRKEFKEDVEDSISKAIKKSKPKKKPKKKTKASGKGKYAGMSSSELYQLVKQKRNQILSRRGIPEKLPRGKAALISICKRVKA